MTGTNYTVQPGKPIDVKDHPDNNIPPVTVSTPQYRINSAFQALQDGDMDKPKKGMDDSGR